MNKTNIIFVLLLAMIIVSCTEKEITIPEYKPPATEKAILVEEFTGVRCSNCPNGAKIIKGMEDKYGDLIVAIAIHSGDHWANPHPSSKYDLKTEDGDNLTKLLVPINYPSASFNRVFYEDQDEIPVSSDSWQSSLEIELRKPNVAFIDMISEYDTDTRKISITVTISPLVNLKGNFNLSLAVTENKIIDSQTMPSGEINKEYEFENVLKDMITPYDGTFIGSDLAKGDKIIKSFTYILPSSDDLWIPENIDLVAYITGGKESSFLPVLNAVKKHLIN